MKQKILASILSIAAILSVFSGCGSPSSPPAAENSATAASVQSGQEADDSSVKTTPAHKELTLYFAFNEADIPTYVNAFQNDTGIKVNYVRLSAGEMLARVTAEKNNPQASVMVAGGSDTYIAANEAGLLDPYVSPENENALENMRDPNGVWNPIYWSVQSFACNSEWFQANGLDYPKVWADLLKPEFKGEIVRAHPTTSGPAYFNIALQAQMWGEEKMWEYQKQLHESIRRYVKSDGAVTMDVALGEAAIAIASNVNAMVPKAEGYPIEIIFPEDGTGAEIGACALIKNGPAEERENAIIFIDWMMSVRGQELYIDSGSNFGPTNVNAKLSEGLMPVTDMKLYDYDVVWAGENRTRLQEEFKEKVDNGEKVAS